MFCFKLHFHWPFPVGYLHDIYVQSKHICLMYDGLCIRPMIPLIPPVFNSAKFM